MFERFTPPARSVVAQAQDEARSLDQDYIGTEHLLLAIMTGAPSSVAATVLTAHGETAERLREEILATVGRGDGAPSGHLTFTPRSKKVLELSLREALRLKSKEIGPEHILLGLLREGEGLACQILRLHGSDLGVLRNQVVARLSTVSPLSSFEYKPPRMTAGAAKASRRAQERASAGVIGSQHYLLGLLDDEDSVAAKVLASLGVDRQAVEAGLAEIGTEGTSDEPPERLGALATSLELRGNAIVVAVEAPELVARLRPAFGRLQAGVLRGLEIPRADRLWSSVRTALEAVATDLGAAPVHGNWVPPGWQQSGVATYAMVSQPGGTASRWWTATGTDQAAVAAWLADWLGSQAPAADRPCVYLTVCVGRTGDVVPTAADPEAFMVSTWSTGAGPAPADWPRLPLADLVAAAIADLRATPPGPEAP